MALCFLCLLSACVPSARETCEAIPLNASTDLLFSRIEPADGDSFCARGPRRHFRGEVDALLCCQSRTSDECGVDCTGFSGATLGSVGLITDQPDSGQCCVLTREGKVAATYVRFD